MATIAATESPPVLALTENRILRFVYSGWSGQANLAAGIIGALLFGFMAERWGARRMLIVSHLLTAAAAAGLLLVSDWSVPSVLIAAIFVFTTLQVFRDRSRQGVSLRNAPNRAVKDSRTNACLRPRADSPMAAASLNRTRRTVTEDRGSSVGTNLLNHVRARG